MRKLYEIFEVLEFQKRIVAEAKYMRKYGIRSQNKQKIRAFSRRDEFAIFSHRIVGLCCVIYSGNHSEGVMKEKALTPFLNYNVE